MEMYQRQLTGDKAMSFCLTRAAAEEVGDVRSAASYADAQRMITVAKGKIALKILGQPPSKYLPNRNLASAGKPIRRYSTNASQQRWGIVFAVAYNSGDSRRAALVRVGPTHFVDESGVKDKVEYITKIDVAMFPILFYPIPLRDDRSADAAAKKEAKRIASMIDGVAPARMSDIRHEVVNLINRMPFEFMDLFADLERFDIRIPGLR